jgi:hypothetical protein
VNSTVSRNYRHVDDDGSYVCRYSTVFAFYQVLLVLTRCDVVQMLLFLSMFLFRETMVQH